MKILFNQWSCSLLFKGASPLLIDCTVVDQVSASTCHQITVLEVSVDTEVWCAQSFSSSLASDDEDDDDEEDEDDDD